MTFGEMRCDAAERERRIAVCTRLNVLAHKRERVEPAQAKRIDRTIAVILRQERPWMKEAVYFLY